MKNTNDQDLKDELIEVYSEARSALKNIAGVNGYIDEFIGSWHRYVDAKELQSQSLSRIADAFEIIAETYKQQVVK